MFDTLLTMEASGGGGGGGGSEELIAYEVSQITEKLSQRGRFDVPGIQMQYPVLCDLGVPSCGGAFTPSTRLVSVSR